MQSDPLWFRVSWGSRGLLFIFIDFFTFSQSSILLVNLLYSKLDLKCINFSPNSQFSLLILFSQFFRCGLSLCLIPSAICKEFRVEIFINLDNNFSFYYSIIFPLFYSQFFNFYFTHGLTYKDLSVLPLGDLLVIYFSFCLCFMQSKFRYSLYRGFVDGHFANIIFNKNNYKYIYINQAYFLIPYMEPPQQQKQSQILTLLQLAFMQRKFKKVIELANNYLLQFPQSKHIYMSMAKAHSELNKPQQCLKNLENATRAGASLKQISTMKIRSHIELGDVKGAQKSMNDLMKEDQEIKTIIQLSKSIDLLKDQFQIHKLSQKQDRILNQMKTWLQSAGGTYPKLMVTNLYPGYRGVVATRHIKKREPIVYIPKGQLISLQMAKASPITKQIYEKKVKLQSPKHTFLSLLLLQLKSNPQSKYKPYIDLLPDDHSCFPINYSQKQLQMLNGSPFLKMILEKVIDLKNDYNNIITCDPTLQKFSFKQFCWARTMIGSRIFGIVVSGYKTQVLVPFADMLNHRQPKQTIWNYVQSVNGFVIQSLEDIEVGQEVFDSYGRKCNSRFLLNYGFILEDNPDNQIPIKLQLDIKDPLNCQKRRMIKEKEDEPYIQVRKINLNVNNNRFYQLMGCLRFICIQEVETVLMLKKISNIQVTKQAYAMMRTPPLSVKMQIAVWEKLKNLCQTQLSEYPNSIEEDIQLLKSQGLSQNQKNIINLRKGQKYILKEFIKICSEAVEVLKSADLVSALEAKADAIFSRYLYKILCLTPGVNKKALQNKLSHRFANQSDSKQQQTEQIPES